MVIIGGSDAGISAALRAQELASSCKVTLIVADRFLNSSICAIPYPWDPVQMSAQARVQHWRQGEGRGV